MNSLFHIFHELFLLYQFEYYEMFPEKLDFNRKNKDDGEFILSFEPYKIIPFFNMYPSIVKNANIGGGTINKPNYNINAPMAFEIKANGEIVNKFSMALEYPENPGHPEFQVFPPCDWYLIGCYSELTALNGSLWNDDSDYYNELCYGSVLNKHENFNTIIKFYGKIESV